MKTNKLLAGLLLIGGLFTVNGQTTSIQTTTLTSFGDNAGNLGTLNTFYGKDAGDLATASTASSTFIGHQAGKNTTASSNTFVGSKSGFSCITGTNNAFFGSGSGSNTTGALNTFIGSIAGSSNTTGTDNVYVGYATGVSLANGIGNIFLGYFAGSYSTGSYNTIIGHTAGQGSTGSGNIFLGRNAGVGATVSNQLFIEPSFDITTPLIWGDFALDQIKLNGQVGVGGVTTFPDAVGGVNTSTYKLFVQGGVLATEVRVATTWSDYVFEDNYALPTLDEVECFIDENGHLPNVPSAKQVADEGISVGEMAKIQQEKIEELTLYIIAQDKQFKAQQLKQESQEKELNDLKVLVQGLIEKK